VHVYDRANVTDCLFKIVPKQQYEGAKALEKHEKLLKGRPPKQPVCGLLCVRVLRSVAFLISPRLSSSLLVSPRLFSSLLVSPRLSSSLLVSPRLSSSLLVSFSALLWIATWHFVVPLAGSDH
jgi:hypothetical protein